MPSRTPLSLIRGARLAGAMVYASLLIPGMAMGNTPDVPVNQPTTMRADPNQVRNWNRFVDRIYQLHLRQVHAITSRKESQTGGYAAGIGGPDFYREDTHLAMDDGRLLSRIRWEQGAVHAIHSIQVRVYDSQGNLSTEYIATYLPDFQNAPIQTFVNLHQKRDGLAAFRQFDANGQRLYEQCRGVLGGESVWWETEFFPVPEDERASQLYQRCFDGLADSPGDRIDPLHGDERVLRWPAFVPDSEQELVQLIRQYDHRIQRTPLRADLRVKRGDAYFMAREFGKAVEDYEAAMAIDDAMDEAWFGRGMARARLGLIREGIEDLNVYLERNPRSSLGFTKRGIRYLWLGDRDRAESDFERALAIDPYNAEAHSDLGVLLAQREDYAGAIRHMKTAVENDPTYQKAFHNLALVHYLQGQPEKARVSVDKALSLNPEARDSLLLKGEILKALGQDDTGASLQEKAREMPPQGDWSERAPLR